MKTSYLLSCAALAVLSSGGGVLAAEVATNANGVETIATQNAVTSDAAPVVEELVVTAQRRTESLEKVPMTVQAFTGASLQTLNVSGIEDLLKFTPNVTYATNGPGQGSIFMRGLSAGAAGNQSSATIAPFPNVALYLDDQSMQFPARNVDIYVVDLDRVEVLEGPQGTLFGGGAEAGALRYITTKPKLSTTEAKVEGAYGFTTGGDPNSSLNAVLNVPILEDKFAVRAVVYNDRHGGYIDNVPSTFTRSNSDLGNYYFNIKPTNGKCPNGLPAGAAGLCTLSPTAAPQANNYQVAKNDFNPVTYTGARVGALYQFNDDWDILVTESLQTLDVEGMFATYPTGSDFQTLQPYQVTSFTPSFDKDNWQNTAWTVRGKLADISAVYTGGYMLRHIDQQQDYTNYSRTGGGMYYQCTGGSTGFGTAAPQCYSPVSYWRDEVRNTHISQELRFSTPETWRLRGLVGGYWEQYRIYDVMNFDYKTIPACNTANLTIALAGGPVCLGDVRDAPGSTMNDPNIRSDNTAFGEDTQRGYDQTAFFANADFDILPNLTATAGTRYYQYNEFEVGSQYGTTTGCLNVPNGQCVGGTVNINAAHDSVQYKGFKSRAGITWRPFANTSIYFLHSEGFRPGAFNRSSNEVATGPGGLKQFQKPNGYAPDSLTNNEFGIKTELFDRRLQLNVSAYDMMWDNVQLLFFNPTELGNTTFGINGPNYEIKGFEVQFVARPIESVTIQGSSSYNDNQQANSPCLIDNVKGSPAYGNCITQIVETGVGLVPFQNPFGKVGSVAAFSPTWQASLRARYDFRLLGYKAYLMGDGNYTGPMYNEPATYLPGEGVLIPTTTLLRYLQPAYAVFDAQLGIAKDRWYAQLFANNLFNAHGSTFTSSAQFIKSEVPLRPRIFGLKIGASF